MKLTDTEKELYTKLLKHVAKKEKKAKTDNEKTKFKITFDTLKKALEEIEKETQDSQDDNDTMNMSDSPKEYNSQEQEAPKQKKGENQRSESPKEIVENEENTKKRKKVELFEDKVTPNDESLEGNISTKNHEDSNSKSLHDREFWSDQSTEHWEEKETQHRLDADIETSEKEYNKEENIDENNEEVCFETDNTNVNYEESEGENEKQEDTKNVNYEESEMENEEQEDESNTKIKKPMNCRKCKYPIKNNHIFEYECKGCGSKGNVKINRHCKNNQ